MPKFVTIGYGDQVGYDRTPAAQARDAALLGIAGFGVWPIEQAGGNP